MIRQFDIPLSPDMQDWVKQQSAEGLKPRHITRILQLSELTGEAPGSIVDRYKMLEAAVKSTLYGI